MIVRILVMVLLAGPLFCKTSFSQDSAMSKIDRIVSFPAKFLFKINGRVSKINNDVISYSDKELRKFVREEQRVRRKLMRRKIPYYTSVIDSANLSVSKIKTQLQEKEQINKYANYLPGLDSMSTSIKYIESNPALKSALGKNSGQIKEVASSIQNLQGSFDYSKRLSEYLQQRKNALRLQLEKVGMIKDLERINRLAYYYSEKIKSYKELISDQSKMEKAALNTIYKIPAFKLFMSKNSQLAALFPNQENFGTIAGLSSLQNRSDVQGLIQQTIGSTSSSGPSIQNSIQAAQTAMNDLKNKVNSLGGSSSDINIPDFIPNSQKTKSFWKRVEVNTLFQNVQSNRFLPTTTDLGLSVGYKLNDRSVIGLGMSYKMGWGKSIRKIEITHEGIGFRSYLDWKIKGNFFISGGWEENYYHRFYNINQLTSSPHIWKSSALIGIAKKYTIGQKRRGEIKLLFDYFYNKHLPPTQPILFRFGFGL